MWAPCGAQMLKILEKLKKTMKKFVVELKNQEQIPGVLAPESVLVFSE